MMNVIISMRYLHGYMFWLHTQFVNTADSYAVKLIWEGIKIHVRIIKTGLFSTYVRTAGGMRYLHGYWLFKIIFDNVDENEILYNQEENML